MSNSQVRPSTPEHDGLALQRNRRPGTPPCHRFRTSTPEGHTMTIDLDTTDKTGPDPSAKRSRLHDAWVHERSAASAARRRPDAGDEWRHLERAHVLSQPTA